MAVSATTFSKVYWFPERLNEKLLIAFRQSVGDAKIAAIARSPSPTKAGARYSILGPTSAVLRTTGRLGHIFEGGREGGYIIQAGLKTTRSRKAGVTGVRGGSGAKALKLPWGYAASAVGGPMAPKPYLHPAASIWAQSLYNRRASAAMRSLVR